MNSLIPTIRRAASRSKSPGAFLLCGLLAVLLTGCQAGGPRERAPRGLEVAERWTLTEQSGGTSAGLRGVHAVSGRCCWAGGAKGTVLRTTDGGATWQRRPVPGGEQLDFRSVFARDERSAWVASAGAPACIFHTTDGGATWQKQFQHPHPAAFFDAIRFWDERRGLVFSDPVDGEFLILKTDDAGRTWLPLKPAGMPRPQTGEAGFAASGTCMALLGRERAWIGLGGIERARVLMTADAGATWSIADTPIMAGNSSSGIFSVLFLDERRGVAVGGDYNRPDTLFAGAAVTDDGGTTWRYTAGEPPRGFRSCVAAWPPGGPPRALLALGTTGVDVSIDGGENWKPISTRPLNSLSVAPDGSAGWAVGPEGAIVRLTQE